MLDKISVILILILLSSCGLVMEPMPKSWNWGTKPRPLTGVRGFPEADTDYGKGFKSGCQSGWTSSTKGAIDMLEYKIDVVFMAHSPDFATGWWDGHEQCVYIVDWDVL